MERKALFEQLEKGQFERCYLFYGVEAYVRRSAEKMLIEKRIDPGMEVMNMSVLTEPDADEIITNCNTLPFMGECRLVIVRECPYLASGKKKSGKTSGTQEGKQASEEADRLIAYLKNLPDTVCLLFDGGDDVNKTRKLGKYLTSLPGAVKFEALGDAELNKWIRKTVRNMGNTIQQEAMDRLVFLSGRDLTQLSEELEKLSAYAGQGKEIELEAVNLLALRTSEAQVFEMLNALFDGKVGTAMEQTDQLLRAGESRMGILTLISRQIRQMLYAEALRAERRSQTEIAAVLGVSPYICRNILTRSGKRTISQLTDLLTLCTNTEYDFKRGAVREDAGFDRVMLTLASSSNTGK